MRIFSLFFVLLFSFSAFSYEIEEDKKKHLAATMTISSVSTLAFQAMGSDVWRSRFAGIALANVAGFAKEISDDKFDKEDMQYNLVGSIIGSFLVWEF